MGTKRLTYFDLAKGFGILLVVYGHIEYISEEMRGWISSFHMPLFFVISGMLIAYKCEESLSLKDVFIKKTRGIIIPYLWFSLLYFFIDIMNVSLHKIDMKAFIENAISSVTFYGVSVLWFLPALFIGEITALFLISKLRKVYLLIPVSLVISLICYFIQIKISVIYDINVDVLLISSLINFVRVFIRGIIASFFVVSGYSIFNMFLRKNESFSVIELVLGLVLFVVNLFLSTINGCVDFHYIILKNVPMFFICAILGSMAIILISKNIKPIAFIQFFGKNSLVIMATHIHCYILYAGIRMAWWIDTFVTRAKSYIFMFNIMVFTMLIECIIVLIINKYFPFVLGKKIKK